MMNPKYTSSQMELLTRYLSGEATAEEAMRVHDWMQDPELNHEFQRFADLWNQLPGTAVKQAPDRDEVWTALQTTLTKTEIPVRRLNIFRYAIAVSIAGVVIVLSLIWNHQQQQKSALSPSGHLTTLQAAGATKTQRLPDGSQVIINKESTLRYAHTFNQHSREVHLTGESYFNVVHQQDKPFIIHVDDLSIQVVGTSFNVRTIPGKHMIEVQVQQGVVKMYTGKSGISVKSGQTGIYDQRSKALKLTEGIDRNSLGYATKTFSFNDLPLPEVCGYLQSAFNVTIQADTARFSDCRITAQFENRQLPYILDVINATFNTTSRQEGDTVFITGEGCR